MELYVQRLFDVVVFSFLSLRRFFFLLFFLWNILVGVYTGYT